MLAGAPAGGTGQVDQKCEILLPEQLGGWDGPVNHDGDGTKTPQLDQGVTVIIAVMPRIS